MPLQRRPSLGEGAEHQPVPRCQRLVVQQRVFAIFPRNSQRFLAPADDVQQPFQVDAFSVSEVCGSYRNVQYVLSLEVATLRHAEEAVEQGCVLTAQNSLDFRGRPDEELAFLALAVGVRSGEEATVLAGHLPQDVVQGFLGDAAIEGASGSQPSVEVEAGQ